MYHLFYFYAQMNSLASMLEYTRWEVGFIVATWAFAQSSLDFWWYALALKIGLLGAYGYFSRLLLGSSLLAAMACVGFIILVFESYSTNAMRQGLSTTLLFLSLVFLLKGRWKIAVAGGVMAALCHSSAVVFLAVGMAAAQPWFRIPLRPLLWSTFAVLAVYAFNGWVWMATPITSALSAMGLRYAIYGESLFTPYVIGFKPTFFLASSVVWGACATLLRSNRRSPMEDFLVTVSLLITCIYLLISGFPYYDRIGSTSWMLAPVLLGLVVRRFRFAAPTNFSGVQRPFGAPKI